MKIKSYIGHRIREFAIHPARLTATRSRPSVVILGSIYGAGSSGDLRGGALCRELRRLGWRAFFVPPQLELVQRHRLLRNEKPDVIMLQQSRHPFNHPKYYPDYPIVFDVDDADIYDPKCRDQVIDCCRGSMAITVGNSFLGKLIEEYNRNIHVIWTGSYLPLDQTKKWQKADRRIVSWANSGASAKTAESDFVQEVLCSLAEKTDFEFWIYGIRSQELAEANFSKLRYMKIKIRSFKMMSYKKLARKLRSSSVGLAPLCEEVPFSRGKSFGKVLTYLAAKVPVVASHAVDYPFFFKNGINGMVVSNKDIEKWVEAISKFLEEPQYRKTVAERASEDFQRRLTVSRSAELFDRVFKDVMKEARI